MKKISVVLTIISVIIILLFQSSRCLATTYKVTHTKVVLEQLEDAINKFYADTGSFPVTLEVLNQKPSNISNWKGPYLKKEIPVDAWKNPYIYIYPAKYGTKKFDLYSWGENGKDDFGLKDDISNWRQVDSEYYRIYAHYWVVPSIIIFVLLSLIIFILFLLYKRFRRKRIT